MPPAWKVRLLRTPSAGDGGPRGLGRRVAWGPFPGRVAEGTGSCDSLGEVRGPVEKSNGDPFTGTADICGRCRLRHAGSGGSCKKPRQVPGGGQGRGEGGSRSGVRVSRPRAYRTWGTKAGTGVPREQGLRADGEGPVARVQSLCPL